MHGKGGFRLGIRLGKHRLEIRLGEGDGRDGGFRYCDRGKETVVFATARMNLVMARSKGRIPEGVESVIGSGSRVRKGKSGV